MAPEPGPGLTLLRVWNGLFGSRHDAKRSPRAGEVGLRDEQVPASYWQPLRWPFVRNAL